MKRLGPLAALLALLLAPTLAAPADGATRRMFITSVSGRGNLGDWNDAGAAVGLAAADAICAERAEAFDPEHADEYVAWISSSQDDAWCRVQGLAGKRSDSCGQQPLPGAGPWVRVDGVPFGAGLATLLQPSRQVLAPPRIDELGNEVHGFAWTSTGPTGEYAGFGCNDWTTTISSGYVGSSDHTGSRWTAHGGVSCNEHHHLLCMQKGTGDPLAAPATWGRLAFLSTDFDHGDLRLWPGSGGVGGADGADAICRYRATLAGLPEPNSFRAWISDTPSDAPDRFLYDGPWVRLDGVRIANGLGALASGYLEAPLNVTDTLRYETDEVWTGTTAAGVASPDRCADWSLAAGGSGLSGATDSAEAQWSAAQAVSCATTARLYCLQDLPLVFRDGFESGGTATWSAATP